MNRSATNTRWESPTSNTLHQTLDAVKSGQRLAKAFPIRRATYVLRCSEKWEEFPHFDGRVLVQE